jgi:AraC family transcriptional regulator, transcriptional activator FtrA
MAQHHRRTLVRALAYALAIVLVPLLTGVAGLGVRIAGALRADTNPPPYTGDLPAPPPHDPAKPTAVIIAANSGTEGSDFLAPYEVIATSGAFNLYAVAPERRVTHLFPGRPALRGVDFVPHYAMAEYDRAIGADPDLIVIPYLPNTQAPEYATIMSWIRAHAGPQTILLSICAGATNLADTGLLARRSATTHHLTFSVLEQRHPDVRLVRGVRYVEDGNIITSAGITAGVDAALFTLKRMLGQEAALDVAGRLGYPHARFLDDPTYEPPVVGTPGMLLSGYQLGNSQLGVALYPGIGEIALGSVIDTYPHQGTVTVNTVAPERAVVRSRNGLALIPRWGFADAPKLDRVILPGTDTSGGAAFEGWARDRYGLAVEQVHQGGGYPYDVTLEDMARRAGGAIAAEAVYLLEYPAGSLAGVAPAYPPGLVARLVALALLGLGLAIVIDRRRGARTRRHAATQAQATTA